MTDVTIVISTYNRPGFLAYAIKSVLAQSLESWKLLIIGDCCDDETAILVSSFADQRIFYVNLKERCGEQSGPNSAGILAADTEYVALLNHDDIWLSDHLEKGIAQLKQSNADLYHGAAGFTTHARAGGGYRPAFNAVTPALRKIEQIFDHMPSLFEPASSWIFKRSLVDKTGGWLPAATLYRTPLENWLLRVWRADAKLLYSEEVTVIYCNAEKRKWFKSPELKKMNMYDLPPEEQAYWWAHMSSEGSDGLREMVRQDVARISRTPNYFSRKSEVGNAEVLGALLTPATAELYKQHGWDAFDAACQMQDKKLGFTLQGMLTRRTGQTLETINSWDEAIAFVGQELSQKIGWIKVDDH